MMLRDPTTLMCCAGSVSIEPHGLILAAGERHTSDGNVRVCGREGTRAEWLNDSGIIVVALFQDPR